ncbi:hypothetical protein [Hyphomicrobium sp.]|uniref:hypothetical protein n=1 Tax=Hyphomicrobium sp. TaxID=82 RepID=UPI000F9C311A|nr:hypothetical protein [Hyphomicrobium sp.]RUO98209.1 MAG: hypothetical protein EKK30_12045 [Hyphomicrobium sp.]
MEYIPLLLQVVSGALGGNVAGSLLKSLSLGMLGNTITGIVGGGIGSLIVDEVFSSASGMGVLSPIDAMIQILGGSLGGAVLVAAVSAFRSTAAK